MGMGFVARDGPRLGDGWLILIETGVRERCGEGDRLPEDLACTLTD
jgi:hypothetical protein